MKLHKTARVLALLLCMALVAGGSIMATMAYLMDSDEAVNTFTMGRVAINLDEADVEENGQTVLDPATGSPAARVQANTYHLIPGQTYTKDPMITLEEGSEPAYVRMIVILNKAAALKSAFGEDFLPQNYVSGWDPETWPCTSMTEKDGTIILEFRYHEVTEKAKNAEPMEPLFTHFTLPGSVNGQQLQELTGFEIKVQGHAIQAAGFADADAAWAAFNQQFASEQAAVTP